MERRQLLKAMVATGAALRFLSPYSVWAQGAEEGYLALVHPDLRPLARQMFQFTAAAPALSPATLAQWRATMLQYVQPTAADVPIDTRIVRGAKGQPDVKVFLINGGRDGARPAILNTHGGGFVTGTAAVDNASLQQICKALDCVAVNVEYRLAPETRFAGSVEDNYAGLKWLYDNAEQLGVDQSRIAVMGSSAGGGHAALLAIAARDRGEVPLAFQCLIYPMLDDRTGSSRPVPDHIGRLIWTAASNRFGWESFLGVKPGRPTVPRGAIPARVENLEGLPPAFIGVGTLDLFCDEDIEYARRLNAAGVPAELIVVPGAFHGFNALPGGAPIAQWFNAAKLAALRCAFSNQT
ncbi:alpha/beta hydrolase domain-containing protein [Sphingobium chlorophenolicum L-1]|uniref:Alpha/beta hydrolase domain-containing protein n=1 Tax=Sphingobium chlorophenolicum L-1 TaxID=690566 RepID=F6F153_SPHCR|nr:alpha/beta hydrolase [Sphingobium chlorophenolicum]AEG51269.1 alpha/beta hydrolase domain-containing protein [Sphingobium chlorophenolicum L-1]